MSRVNGLKLPFTISAILLSNVSDSMLERSCNCKTNYLISESSHHTHTVNHFEHTAVPGRGGNEEASRSNLGKTLVSLVDNVDFEDSCRLGKKNNYF